MSDQDHPYRKVVLLIPEPYSDAWTQLVSVSQDIKACENRLPSADPWPVLALAVKAAHTTTSIAILAAMHQWPDALVLGRSLFEAEIMMKWMLENETEKRVEEYLKQIDEEKDRLKRKMHAARSVSAQLLRDLVPPETFATAEGAGKSSIGNIRDRARQTNVERSYDLSYWLASLFAHSNALSLASLHPSLKDSPLTEMVRYDDEGLACFEVLGGIPWCALDAFALANHRFELGLSNELASTRNAFARATSEHIPELEFSTDLDRGDVRFKLADGTVRTYKPPRPGRDPVDELL